MREPLPEWAEDVLDALADAAFEALGDVPGEEDVWEVAEKSLAPANTQYDRGRKIAAGGQLAAHALRLAAGRKIDPQPWEAALASLPVAVVASTDWDERTRAGLDLRTSFKDLDAPAPRSVYPVRLVADWLINSGRRPSKGVPDELMETSVRMARHALGLEPQDLADAWFATHGPALLELLGGPLPESGGARGLVLRYVAQRVWSTGVYTLIQQLAAAAGVSRHSVRAWIAQGAVSGILMPVDESTPAGTPVRSTRAGSVITGTLTGRQKVLATAAGGETRRYEVLCTDGVTRWATRLTTTEG